MSAQTSLRLVEFRDGPESEVAHVREDEYEASKSLLEIRGDLDNSRIDGMLGVLSLSKDCLQGCISSNRDKKVTDRIESFFEEEDGLAAGVKSEVVNYVKKRTLRRCSKAVGEECLRRQLVRDQELYDSLIWERCLSPKRSVI